MCWVIEPRGATGHNPQYLRFNSFVITDRTWAIAPAICSPKLHIHIHKLIHLIYHAYFLSMVFIYSYIHLHDVIYCIFIHLNNQLRIIRDEQGNRPNVGRPGLRRPRSLVSQVAA